MFAIWGFLAWKFVDGRGRARWRNHAEVVFFGLVFSVGIETVQFFLPTRAADRERRLLERRRRGARRSPGPPPRVGPPRVGLTRRC